MGGAPVLVMLHGLGAHAGVWSPMLASAAEHWPGTCLSPDLRGHGKARWTDDYRLNDHAGDIGRHLLQRGSEDGAVILGHSMGGAVGLALASGRFGVRPARVLAFGVKALWSEEERSWLSKLAVSPVRHFETREEAADRFLKASGLAGLTEAESGLVRDGIVANIKGWRLAADPTAASVGPPPMDALMAAARCPVRLAAGEFDPMSKPDHLRRWDPEAVSLPGLGHNAMVEDPETVWRWVRAECGLG